jgi:uncharacterized Ntn-hydrolase superfamily protein
MRTDGPARPLRALLLTAFLAAAPHGASADLLQAPDPPEKSAPAPPDPDLDGTFSIIGRDPATGELGIAVHSKTVAVGSRTRGGKGGVAVFAHQAASNPMYSTIGVQLLEAGMSPEEALAFMLRADEGADRRQVAILDIQGRTAAWTSPSISEWKGHRCGANYCAQGNTLEGPEVVEAMARSFEGSAGGDLPLAERLLDALQAGQNAGGDRRGVQSAALLILKPLSLQGFGDRSLDLRVDEHRDPFGELRRVLRAFRAREQMGEARSRLAAGDPAGARELAAAARENHPEDDGPWLLIAELRLRSGEREGALEALAEAVRRNPANRRQIPRLAAFQELREDPAFRRLLDGGR